MAMPSGGWFGVDKKCAEAEKERMEREHERQLMAYVNQSMQYQTLGGLGGAANNALNSLGGGLVGISAAYFAPTVQTGPSAIEQLAKSVNALKGVEAQKIVNRVPDFTATLTGWRAWKFGGDRLVALGQSHAWEPKKAVAAVCTNYSSVHTAPARDCKCGYWSFKDLDTLMKALPNYAGSVAVLGSVEIWGKVVDTENGYRSEYAYPKELWLIGSDLESLSWTYGVPVRKMP